jgi:LmbE family N-acetylglucosaminyl deacetylase
LNVLAFFAHPDDETMLVGGTLALLARNGAQVHYLCATRGEGGETGEPPLCSVEELGAVREAELVCAVQALGGRTLTFLGYTDPRVGPDDSLFSYTEDLTLLAGQVATSVHQAQAGVVFTHGSNGEYGHPAHVTTHLAARIAVESFGADAPLLYSVAAMFPEHPRPRLANHDDPADLVVNISPALEQKTAAALCHRTQHALFTRQASWDAGRLLGVPEVIQPLESLRRVYPGAEGPVEDDLARFLLPWSVSAGPGR